jgi:hypothetical protein
MLELSAIAELLDALNSAQGDAEDGAYEAMLA